MSPSKPRSPKSAAGGGPDSSPDVARIAQDLRSQPPDARALGRGLSWIENRDPRGEALLAALRDARSDATLSRSTRFGITGAPGVGKSSLIAALLPGLRATGETVAVVAVDPTSPRTGGAFLGDRLRMNGHEPDPGVTIRSLATRSESGGIPSCTDEAAELLGLVGFGIVLIETVGVGQLELEIVDAADHVFLLLSPEAGDTIQFLKGGVMEVVDQLVVTKGDRAGSDAVLAHALELADERGLPPPIRTQCPAGPGIDEIVAIMVDSARERRRLPGRALDPARFERRIERRLSLRAEERWLKACWARAGGKPFLRRLAGDVASGARSFAGALDAISEAARVRSPGDSERSRSTDAGPRDGEDSP